MHTSWSYDVSHFRFWDDQSNDCVSFPDFVRLGKSTNDTNVATGGCIVLRLYASNKEQPHTVHLHQVKLGLELYSRTCASQIHCTRMCVYMVHAYMPIVQVHCMYVIDQDCCTLLARRKAGDKSTCTMYMYLKASITKSITLPLDSIMAML